MKPTAYVAIWIWVLSLIIAVAGSGHDLDPPPVARQYVPPPQVYFSPNGGCTAAIERELGAAQHSVLVQAYSFTSEPIVAALNAASARNLDVQTILDRGQKTMKNSRGWELKSPLYYDHLHAIAHNKVIIIDRKIVITGSFNFTQNAEKHNAENLLIIHDPELAQQYLRNWELHRNHSQRYQPLQLKPGEPSPAPGS